MVDNHHIRLFLVNILHALDCTTTKWEYIVEHKADTTRALVYPAAALIEGISYNQNNNRNKEPKGHLYQRKEVE